SAAEAVAYAKALHSLVTWLGICDGNMAEGSFRVDANVSVRPQGQTEFGTRCEIKNLNSFRFLEQAINYEVERQIDLIEDGGKVVQETRLFNPDTGETRAMRSKEDAHDYRYFPDPDLMPIIITDEMLQQAKDAMPELPKQMAERFVRDYGITDYDARVLTTSPIQAAYFEEVAQKSGEGKLSANWINGDLAAALNKEEKTLNESPVSAERLAGLIQRITDGTLSGKLAKKFFEALWTSDLTADEIIERDGLKQVTDTGAIEKMVDEVIAANQKSVEEYQSGKEKAFNALVGQVMKASRGKANPQQVQEILKNKLG
ncbi:MAG: Asp-tRNA(Asn)/Glu-tRNA(Gln) amidotransferase subunit GatB, partial [Neisseriaceae bacterium]|nr:Asp-tRNA(Asn)/Glu-tRNA(Gln) amidotransferase subunit GatB [Neisseriaceae bacterium]